MHNLASNDLDVDENEKIKYVNLEYTVYGIRVHTIVIGCQMSTSMN